jgi:hypothetical protein
LSCQPADHDYTTHDIRYSTPCNCISASKTQDKTFGLKNKKGAKTQKFIQHVHKNQLGNIEAQKAASKAGPSKKEERKKAAEELNMIFKPVAPVQKLEAGVNPKSVLCAFHKQNTCTKGDKCKFSHDLSLARKAATKNFYETEPQDKKDSMEDWDEEKLKEVVEKKHGETDRKKPKTDIICKHFLDALESSKYGWFWECPSGDKCIYRHVLPIGFVLKKDMKKDKKEEISIEDLVEKERASLGYDLPKINLHSFLEWKKRKIEEKRRLAADDSEKRKTEFVKTGKAVVTGREMFTFNPDLVKEEDMDDGEATFDTRNREDLDDSDVKAFEVDLEKLAAQASDVNGSSLKEGGTVVDSRDRKFDISGVTPAASGAINEDLFDDFDDLEEENDDDGEEDVASAMKGVTITDKDSPSSSKGS